MPASRRQAPAGLHSRHCHRPTAQHDKLVHSYLYGKIETVEEYRWKALKVVFCDQRPFSLFETAMQRQLASFFVDDELPHMSESE